MLRGHKFIENVIIYQIWQKLGIKTQQKWLISRNFEELKLNGQTVLPDMSILIEQEIEKSE